MPSFLRIALVLVVLLPAAALADARKYDKVQILSTEVPQSWAYGSMTDHRLIWDAEKKEFRAELTFTDAQYLSDNSPQAERETYECPFPGVSFDEKSNTFIAKTTKGKPVPVAKRVKTLFGYQNELLPTSRVVIINIHGKLVVILGGTTDPGFATGMNKWIVRPQGWYLQNVF
jgi:hypothetical protein